MWRFLNALGAVAAVELRGAKNTRIYACCPANKGLESHKNRSSTEHRGSPDSEAVWDDTVWDDTPLRKYVARHASSRSSRALVPVGLASGVLSPQDSRNVYICDGVLRARNSSFHYWSAQTQPWTTDRQVLRARPLAAAASAAACAAANAASAGARAAGNTAAAAASSGEYSGCSGERRVQRLQREAERLQ